MSVNTWILGKLQWEFNLPNAWQSTWKEERVLLIADTQGGPEGCLSPWDQPRDLSLYGCLWYIYILIGKLVYLVYTPGSKKRSQLPLKVVLVRGYARPHSKIASIQLGESLWSINISCVYMYTYTHTRTYILYMYIFDISILWKFYYLVSSNHCHHLSFGMQSKASYDWWFLN